MGRYDSAWDRSSSGRYDRSFQQPGGGWGEPDRGPGPGGIWRGEPSRGHRSGWDAPFNEGVYGPARYGLGPYHERLRKRRRSDEELREEVEGALFYDTWVDAEAITVEVKDGVVTLRGQLPSYEEIRFATDDAWDVDGVAGVRSELSVGGR